MNFRIGRIAVVFDIAVDCLVCSSSGVRSICAGLTRSAVTVSTLPLINTLNTRPLLARPYTVRRKGQSAVVQLRFVAKIHVNMCRAFYIGTYLFDLSRGGLNRRRDMAMRNLSE